MVAFFIAWPIMRKRRNVRWAYLLTASFIFYGWWDWRFLFLIIFSGLIDYTAGLLMVKYHSRKKLFLALSLLANLGTLAVFKYLDFAVCNTNWLLAQLGFELQMSNFNLILPIGISFYTFQSMSYTIDIYKGTLKPTRNILHFFAYLAMFPQLVAGPIVRACDMLPQLLSNKPITEEQQWQGMLLITRGYFKKMVIADTLGRVVDAAFSTNELSASCGFWWLIMAMFAYQIYCDFSGYSDIARGLGKWMGYEFPLNFDHPYISTSFRDFWSRWHISLSTWFRDYVYIPLGGSQKGSFKGYSNMCITMLISGLWHGAKWHFVIWGALHAFFLLLERLSQWPNRLKKTPGGRTVSMILIFLLTTLAWVFFRADSLTQATAIISIMLTPSLSDLHLATEGITMGNISLLILIIMRQMYYFFGGTRELICPKQPGKLLKALETVTVATILIACVLLRNPGNVFIYFNF